MTFGFGISLLSKPPDILTHVDFVRPCESLRLISCDLSDMQRPITFETMIKIARIENDPFRIDAISTDEGQVKVELCILYINSSSNDLLPLDGNNFATEEASVIVMTAICFYRSRDEMKKPEARSQKLPWNNYFCIYFN